MACGFLAPVASGKLAPCSRSLPICHRQAVEATEQEGSGQMTMIRSQRLLNLFQTYSQKGEERVGVG